jgi:hypothetical protein
MSEHDEEIPQTPKTKQNKTKTEENRKQKKKTFF